MSAPAPWEVGMCRVPMWMGGMPAGLCGETAYGHQYPQAYLYETRSQRDSPFCSGHCCPAHGGPREGEPIIFQDGWTNEGRPMYCAVMPGFVNLQESPAGFSGNSMQAVKELRAALANCGSAP